MNFFQQGVPLGRWFGISVVLHWTFLAYAAFQIFESAQQGGDTKMEIFYMVLLFSTVLLHEFGHALSCKAIGGVAIHIVLWPLGGIAFIQPPGKAVAWLITTVCGPLVNAILWPVFYLLLNYGIPRLAEHMNPESMLFQALFYGCWYMVAINRALLLFNLIPAYPMDGGRILQEILWMTVGYKTSLQVAGMIGTVIGVSFVCLGAGVTTIHIPVIDMTLGGPGSQMLIYIGILCAMQSFGIYKRSQEIQGWRKN